MNCNTKGCIFSFDVPNTRAMLTLFWNCQGAGRPQTIQRLIGLVQHHRPSLVFLIETKNKVKKMEAIRRRTGFPHRCYVAPSGLAGGLALWWSDDLNVTILKVTKCFFHIKCSLEGSNWSWFTTLLYTDSNVEI